MLYETRMLEREQAAGKAEGQSEDLKALAKLMNK